MCIIYAMERGTGPRALERRIMMKTYTSTCPYCGTVNKDIYLSETGGRYECINCMRDVLDVDFKRAEIRQLTKSLQLFESRPKKTKRRRQTV